jgi:hypothetical protein
VEPPAPSTPAHGEPADRSPRPASRRCRIRCWHGYLWSQFYAEPEDEPGAAVALSPSFRRRGREPPGRRPEAERALAVLLEDLTGRGWLPESDPPTSPGTAWYELTLVRRSR